MNLSLLCAAQTEPEIELLPASEIADWKLDVAHVVIRIRADIPVTQFDHDEVIGGIVHVESELFSPIGVQVIFDNFCLEALTAEFHQTKWI